MSVNTVIDHPAVVAAVTALAPLRARRAALERERADAWSIGGYRNTYVSAAGPPPDEEEIILARVRLAELDTELRRLRLAEIPAERAMAAATEQARADVAKAIDARRAAAVAKLDAALAVAARANAIVAELDAEAESALGTFAARFAWSELLPERPSCDTRISAWRRSAKEHGLL